MMFGCCSDVFCAEAADWIIVPIPRNANSLMSGCIFQNKLRLSEVKKNSALYVTISNFTGNQCIKPGTKGEKNRR
jgi:hypothetical protein